MSNINFTYTNLTPFKWYVLENFPFIEADFDALTNWQLFCKLGKEMNKIINSVNVSGQQVETLTTAFNNLQNYVNNYFDNLNVQTEINNKLDEMTENGTLDQIINTNLFSELNNKINSVVNGSPIPVSSTEEMTDTSKIYVLTSNGEWYYYNNNEWVSGGQYFTAINYDEFINDLTIVDSAFKYPKEKFKNNFSLINNKTIDWVNNTGNTLTIDNFSEKLENSQVSNITNPIRIRYDNGTLIFSNLVFKSLSSQHQSFAHFFDKDGKYCGANEVLFLDTAKGSADFKENYYFMVINYFNNLPEYDFHIPRINVEWLNTHKQEYIVGSSENADFSSVMECFQALANNDEEKTIKIEPGSYDIFEEIGGTDFCNSIPSTATDWRDYSILVPNNTHVIGLGKVELNFLPEAEEISDIASKLLSCINISGSCVLENLIINAKNCRYAIHDETSGLVQYDNCNKTFKNVTINRYKSEKGKSQAYGCGYNTGQNYLFENCLFNNEDGGVALSMHNRNTIGSNNIVFNNCIMLTAGKTALTFYNSGKVQMYNLIKIASSYIDKQISLSINGNLEAKDYVNSFYLDINNCNDFNIYINPNLINNLTNKIYNIIPPN